VAAIEQNRRSDNVADEEVKEVEVEDEKPDLEVVPDAGEVIAEPEDEDEEKDEETPEAVVPNL
jgi:hypothetical protein